MRCHVSIPLALLGLLAGACRAPHSSCTTSADCLDTEVCVEALCRTACEQSSDCAVSETCLGGACMPAGQSCEDDGDCLHSEVCRDGRCRSRCSSDSDCSPLARCVSGVCLPLASDAGGADTWPADGGGPDGALADRRSPDTAVGDAGARDLAAADTAGVDAAGAHDSARPDAGASDAAAADAPLPDALAAERPLSDVHPGDAGPPDAGAPDAAPPSPRPVFRSVGPGNGEPLATGAGNAVALLGAEASFTLPLPDRVGVGDVLLLDADGDDVFDTRLFIHRRLSATSYQLRDAEGLLPAASAPTPEAWALYRAYTSLYDAERGEENAGIDAALRDFDPWADGKDLVAADQVWNIACYADGADTRSGTVVLDGWVTSPTRYLRIYTPVSPDQVGTSQRHGGSWNNGAYRLVLNGRGTVLNNDAVEHLRVEGLQLRQTEAGGSGFRGFWSEHVGASADVRFSHSIIQGPVLVDSANLAWGIEHYDNHETSVHRFWNNIIYDLGEVGNAAGVRLLGDPGNGKGVVYLYSNTIARSRTAIGTYLFQGTVVAKNNVAVGDNFSGSYDPSSTHNAASDGSAPGADPIQLSSGSELDYFTNSSDYHIAPLAPHASELLGAGADLSADPDLAFDDDIDGEARAGSWDLGADQAG